MTFIEVKITEKSLVGLKKLRRKFTSEEVNRSVRKSLQNSGRRMVKDIVKNHLNGKKLNRRSGDLARVIGFKTKNTGAGLPSMKVGVTRAGPGRAYASIRELGTRRYNSKSPFDTIKPVAGKTLAWPQDRALTPAGEDRFGGPRNYPGGLQFIPFRNGGIAKGALYDKQEYNNANKSERVNFSTLLPVYVLLSELDIKPAYFIRAGVRKGIKTLPEEIGVALVDHFTS